MMYLDVFTLSTLQKDEEFCCPNCGSWVYCDDLIYDDIIGILYCPLCKK